MRFAVVVVPLAAVLAACSSSSSSPSNNGGSGSSGGGGAATALSVPDDGTAGAKAINTRNCGKCHNEAGQPPLSGRTTPLTSNEVPNLPADVKLYPPNLTPDKDTGLGNWTDGQIKLAIQNGVDNEGLSLCPQMQHYTTMPDEEANAIVAYLKAMQPVKKSIPSSVCPPLKG